MKFPITYYNWPQNSLPALTQNSLKFLAFSTALATSQTLILVGSPMAVAPIKAQHLAPGASRQSTVLGSLPFRQEILQNDSTWQSFCIFCNNRQVISDQRFFVIHIPYAPSTLSQGFAVLVWSAWLFQISLVLQGLDCTRVKDPRFRCAWSAECLKIRAWMPKVPGPRFYSAFML